MKAKATKNNNYHYNKKLRPLANANRKRMTKSAACLWKYVLRNRMMKGYQFRRERPVLNYIADFVCLELLLIVEVDGITHDDEQQVIKDAQRDADLKEVGFTTLRFSSWEVLNKIDDVSIMIGEWIDENAKVPPPNPRQRGKSKSPPLAGD
ncbi:MAG: DUF559 domain-containing protein [Bacteroidetes bacterium]|nr:MAG: DUF559 domain-containing protein [Bacteroidota bacterium]